MVDTLLKKEEKMLKISIVYDNTIYQKNLVADWGFAAYIETDDITILFDSGSDGHILLENMGKMGLSPKKVDTVFISHHHFDHTGGLAAFLRKNPDVDVYLPESLRGVKRAKNVIHVDKPIAITNTIFSTGELMKIEQSLIIKTPQGLVLIVGCSHPGLENIIKVAAKYGTIYMVLGGFHGFEKFDVLKDVEYVCPTHCTKHIKRIENLYPEKYILGGAGRKIEIPINETEQE
ncbi:MAG: MBL fold metallo-hydrolase [Candidatus Neomarinimicrobiota bacterium]|nr:MAG: MBL fold metallo-hydrolase [Candidatus Neomarinimicrobiota bacterium]